MNNCSDRELVMHLHSDDIKAFEALYLKYEKAVYSNILKLIKDADATQDILQEVFIVMWEKRRTINLNLPVSNWLFSISYYKSVNYLKKSLKESVTIRNFKEEMYLVDKRDINLKETQLHLLEEAVTQLSSQKRKVFDLCKVHGKSYEQTAKELNISKHTVKEYLSEAVRNIKEYVKSFPESSTAFFCVAILSSSI